MRRVKPQHAKGGKQREHANESFTVQRDWQNRQLGLN